MNLRWLATDVRHRKPRYKSVHCRRKPSRSSGARGEEARGEEARVEAMASRKSKGAEWQPKERGAPERRDVAALRAMRT